jgi:hypothetical protein
MPSNLSNDNFLSDAYECLEEIFNLCVANNFNPLAYTATCEAVWATDVLLLILAFCQ